MQSLRCEGKDLLLRVTNHIKLCRDFATRKDNFYKILGLQGNATAVDIKTAYYKLSMLYHPDKNENSEEAAEKFRQITEAYEVLGNFRLKKLYDKGIIHSSADSRHVVREEPVEDDATTRFYKARMHKNKPTATGRTPIYDFDEWTRSHYSATFNAHQSTKHKTERRERDARSNVIDTKSEYSMHLIMVSIFFALIIYSNIDISQNDSPKTTEKNEK